MAERYIDANKIPYVISENGCLDDFAYRYDINEVPTADVVPRAEVGELKEMLDASIAGQITLQNALIEAKREAAREIFAEIDVYVNRLLNDFNYSSGDFDYQYEELKNKYTDGKKTEPNIVSIKTNIFDKEETFFPCTVQVLTNTVTGEVSVGWWKGE